MIRDTSSQDAVLTAAPAQNFRRRAIWSGALLLAVAGAALLLSAWRDSAHAVRACGGQCRHSDTSSAVCLLCSYQFMDEAVSECRH